MNFKRTRVSKETWRGGGVELIRSTFMSVMG